MAGLKITNLNVTIAQKLILQEINLTVAAGQKVAIIGPNGHGKSTLFKTIMGHFDCQISYGTLYFNETCINDLSPDQRFKLGLYLGFQIPLEIEGVNTLTFLKTLLKNKLQQELKLSDYVMQIHQLMQQLQLSPDVLQRSFNVGFSGGEKKKMEVLQLLLLQPQMALLDEIDSGLDIEALQIITQLLNTWVQQTNAGLIVISHYPQFLEMLAIDQFYLLKEGKIVRQGEVKLLTQLLSCGFNF